MERRESLLDGLSYVAWGYFFLNYDINFGMVSILPQFVGFLPLPTEVVQWVFLGLSAVTCIVAFFVMRSLFELRQCAAAE